MRGDVFVHVYVCGRNFSEGISTVSMHARIVEIVFFGSVARPVVEHEGAGRRESALKEVERRGSDTVGIYTSRTVHRYT